MDSLRLRKHRDPLSHGNQSRLELGSRIRALRKIHGWTLDDLARSIDVSKSAISQIESGRIEPSLRTLRRLASALKPPLARLFESPTASIDDRVVRRAQRKVFHLPKDHVRYELLSPDLVDKQVEFYRVELDPHPGERPEPYSHEGEEYGIVVEGRVAVWNEGATYLLQEGDSIFFRATSPHYVSNAGRHTAVTIWAISPPAY